MSQLQPYAQEAATLHDQVDRKLTLRGRTGSVSGYSGARRGTLAGAQQAAAVAAAAAAAATTAAAALKAKGEEQEGVVSKC